MLVLEIPFAYDACICDARRFTEEEKAHYSDWYKDYGFVGTGENRISLPYIHGRTHQSGQEMANFAVAVTGRGSSPMRNMNIIPISTPPERQKRKRKKRLKKQSVKHLQRPER